MGLVEDKFLLLPGSEAPQHGVKDKTCLLLKTALRTKTSPSRDVHGGAWSAPGLSGVDFFAKGDFLSWIHNGNNERKERAGEPYCKPDPRV